MSSTRPDLKFTDAGDERLFYHKYANLPPKDANTIRIVDHNNKDYFTVLNEDADLIANNIYKTQAVVKYNQNGKHRYVTISPQVLTNNVLRFCLIQNQYKVEFYNNKTYELICMATPGNLEALSNEYEVNLEGLFLDGSTPVAAAIKFQNTTTEVGTNTKHIGVCLVDLLSSEMQISEFEDNDLYSNLESLILQLGIKEVIVPSNYDPLNTATSQDYAKFFQVLDRIGGLVITSVKSSSFNAKDIEQDLSKLVVSDKRDLEHSEEKSIEVILASKGIDINSMPLSFSCCNAIIAYLELLSLNSVFTLNKYILSNFMKLDALTLRALNIFPSSLNSKVPTKQSQTVTSIYELLNKCKTNAGSRLLSQWLKQPLTNLKMIKERQQLVKSLIEDTNLRIFFTQEFLPKVPDIKRLIKKLSIGFKRLDGNSSGGENKKLEDVVRLYQLVLVLPSLVEFLEMVLQDTNDELKKQLITEIWYNPIKEAYLPLIKFQELVETTIDLSPLESTSAHDLFSNDFNIRPEFDEDLIAINEKIQLNLEAMKAIHLEVGEDLNMDIDKKLKLEKHQQHGWCFRVTRNDSVVLRNTGKKYNQLQTVKAGVYFTTRELQASSQEYTQLSQSYNLKQRELVKEIISISLTYSTVFTRLGLTLSHVDVITAFANSAIFAPTPFTQPILHPLASTLESDEYTDRQIRLHNARHPVLEVQDDVNFIANDVLMSNPGRPDERLGKSFAIITGPNMGGKSTYIRQVGVIALMAQIGSFVPVEGDDDDLATPELPIFDAILSRVGASDSQLKGLSTFMIEMLETSSILSAATHNSLIIIDELGRGTSTYDGFGLAYAILEYIITSRRCFTLFATHFHELTKLADKYPNQVENLHVVAHIEKEAEGDKEDDITLMYRVEPGVSDKSFGIHVADLVRFPTKIINMAKRKASQLQLDDTDTLSKKTKCTPSEYKEGLENISSILKAWKSMCYDSDKKELKFSADETVERLRSMVSNEFKDIMENDKLIKEITTLL